MALAAGAAAAAAAAADLARWRSRCPSTPERTFGRRNSSRAGGHSLPRLLGGLSAFGALIVLFDTVAWRVSLVPTTAVSVMPFPLACCFARSTLACRCVCCCVFVVRDGMPLCRFVPLVYVWHKRRWLYNLPLYSSFVQPYRQVLPRKSQPAPSAATSSALVVQKMVRGVQTARVQVFVWLIGCGCFVFVVTGGRKLSEVVRHLPLRDL